MNPPWHFAALLVSRLSLVFSKKFAFFNWHQQRADTAINSQIAAMSGVISNLLEIQYQNGNS